MNATSTPSKEQQELQEQLNTLRNDFAEVTRTVRELSAATAQQGQERLRDSVQRSRDQARESLHTLQGEIEQRPYACMAIAFGAGLLLGKLFDRQ